MSIRRMGKASFAHIQDSDGRLQIYIRLDNLGEQAFGVFNSLFDIGDIIGVNGQPFVTKTGETTVEAKNITMLAKSLLSLPDKFYGLKDDDTRFRERYLDLLVNHDSKDRLTTRSRITKTLRKFLDENGFIEVETPILQSVPSGANAQPFITHHNAFDEQLFLRIAPETYLKRLIVGGFDRVYEIGRVFRNEGVDRSHLQDFTMLEFYASYWNAEKNMTFTRNLLQQIVKDLGNDNGKVKIGGNVIDFDGEWPVNRLADLIKQYSGIDIDSFNSEEDLREVIKRQGLYFEGIDKSGFGGLVDKLFKSTTRPHLIHPQFIVGYPVSMSPLARRSNITPDEVDQFQLLVNGWEIAKGYSELIDPLDQKRRLEEQADLKIQGDEESMPLDNEYLKAMEHGMPPNSGVGIGIDRLTALLTNTDNLREVVIFPLMRKEK